MSVPNEIRNLTEEVVASFESGIDAVGLLIEKGLEILDGYRREQEAIRGTMRETMAEVGNLRRKDFDGVMEHLLNFQLQRESEIKRIIKDFLSQQKKLTQRLKRSLAAGISEEVERCKKELSQMMEGVREEILSFQQEQALVRIAFANLETRKDQITVREFKEIIQDLEGDILPGDKPAVSIQQSA